MVQSVGVVITGDAKLNRMLANLKNKDAKKAVRKASRPALKPIKQATERLAPEDTGLLKRNVKIRAIRRSRRRVGARVTIGNQNFTGRTFYGGMQEWGWKAGRRGKPNRRQIEGDKFMRRAVDEKQRSALTIYRAILRREIIAAARNA